MWSCNIDYDNNIVELNYKDKNILTFENIFYFDTLPKYGSEDIHSYRKVCSLKDNEFIVFESKEFYTEFDTFKITDIKNNPYMNDIHFIFKDMIIYLLKENGEYNIL